MGSAERVKNFCDTFQLNTAVLKLIDGKTITIEEIDKWYENIGKSEKLLVSERKAKFADKLIPYVKEYGRELVKSFYEHWTQINENGKKMHFEKQTTFELSRRIKTFKRNSDTNFGKHQPKQETFSPNVVIPQYGN